jgi:hypothetical protein
MRKTVTVDEGNASTQRSKRGYLWIVTFSLGTLALAGAFLFYLSYDHQLRTVDNLLVDLHRDFTRYPFDMVDATEYCQRRVSRRYGSNLVLSYVDAHSTRIDSKTGQYKIFMFAHVGDLKNFEEEAVHCFVDPENRMAVHFRTINLRKASLMSRAARLLDVF